MELTGLLSEAADRPKHERLRNHLMAELASGRLKPGQSLPTEMELAGVLRIARSTVRHALADLERNGFIRRVRGKGTFVHEDAVKRQRKSLDVFALILQDMQGFYPAIIKNFDAAAAAMNHQIITCCSDNDVRRQGDIVLQLIDKQVSGVAIVPPTVGPPPAHQIRLLQSHGIPVVLLNRGVEGVSAPLISLSHERIAGLAVEEMVKAGHRRIAVIFSHEGLSTRPYLPGLKYALRKANLELADHMIHFGSRTTDSVSLDHELGVEAALQKMLSLPRDERPTAIFCPWDDDAALNYLLLSRMGARVPEDISLVSFGGACRQGSITWRLSAVTVDEAEVGRLAARLLDEMSSAKLPLDGDDRFSLSVGFYSGRTLAPIGSAN